MKAKMMVERRKMPSERKALTRTFRIGDEKGYITIGFYEDGTIGEVFVKMDKQGSQVSGFVDAWAIAVSMLLQCSMPLEAIIAKFKGMAFKPDGLTDDPGVPIARSPIDYVVRWLEQFVPKEDGVSTVFNRRCKKAQGGEQCTRYDEHEGACSFGSKAPPPPPKLDVESDDDGDDDPEAN